MRRNNEGLDLFDASVVEFNNSASRNGSGETRVSNLFGFTIGSGV